jgi:hypothetical protein
METDSRNKADNINLVDKSKKVFVRIQLSNNRKYWEKWISKDKKDWELDGKLKSLEDVLKSQQDVIDSNYNNLFNLLVRK